MKTQLTRILYSCAAVFAGLTGPGTRATDLNLDFSGDVPGMVAGSAYVDYSGGVDDGPCLKLTDGFTWENGWFYLWDLDYDLTSGFNAKFKMKIGGGTAPADGLSFNFANDYNTWNPFLGEEGDGTGLSVCFDTYNNGGGEAPAIDVKKGGKTIFSRKGNDIVDLVRTGDFVPVEINVDQEGTLSLTVKNQVIVSGLKRAFTRNWGEFAFGARAGGLTDKHFVDDVQISTTTALAPLPYVVDVFPNGLGAKLDTVVQVKIQDGQSPLNSSSIQMRVDGAIVPVTLEQADGITTVTYTPPTKLEFGKKYVVNVSFSDASATPTVRTETFDFTTLFVRGPNGNYYELGYNVDQFYTWQDAKAAAEARTWGGVHGHLATITDRAEDEFVELVRSVSLPVTDPPIWQEAWVGGYQLPGSAPNQNWFWINNEGPIAGTNNGPTYANWQPGEPNDGYGADSENNLTVGLWNQFGWNDSGNYNYTMLRGYIVEYEAIQMPLDVKPGDPNNRLPSSKGKVNIAVLTTPSFNAASVVVSKLSAGRTGVEARPLQSSLTDVDGDGDLDLVMQFNVQDFGLRCGDTKVIVFAENTDGAPLRGSDHVEFSNCPPYAVAVSALQDAAHNTDIYFTVNSVLPNYTAPTVAEEIGLKSYNLSGRQTWNRIVKNVPLALVNPTTSQGSVQFNDLAHLQSLTARVQVKNSNNGTSEILNGDAKVLLRPDLQVVAVQAPGSAKPRQTVNIKAVISEENHDLGATCTAYLLSGDAIIDHADGVKIQAGKQSTVNFAARFDAPGTYHLRVVAGNVTPGDYNDSNNSSGEFVVEVLDQPLAAASYDMQYAFNKYEYYSEEKSEFGITVYHEKNQYEFLTQTLFIPSAFQATGVRVSASVYADGVEKRFSEVVDFPFDFYNDGCVQDFYGYQYNFAGGIMVIESIQDYCGAYQTGTSVYYSAGGGESGYYSANYTATWDVQWLYGNGYGGYHDYLLPQSAVSTYFSFDGPGLQFGGTAQIPDLSGYSNSDQWNTPTENDGYFKGFYDEKSVTGSSSGLTQP